MRIIRVWVEGSATGYATGIGADRMVITFAPDIKTDARHYMHI